jgi:hypothetical protein
MNQSQTTEQVRMVANQIPGYNYGSSDVAKSPITLHEFELLKQSAGFTNEDERWLHVAGEVLADQAKGLVGKWREVIAGHPHLAKYSQRLDGQRDPRYSERSALRFQHFSSGSLTRVCGLMTRIGSIISKRSRCATPAQRRTGPIRSSRFRRSICGIFLPSAR